MKKKIKKIFIIGSRGSLAKQIIKKLENKFSLTKISRKNIDVVLNFKKLKKIIDKLNPDLIINCIGVTKFLDCEYDPRKAYLANSVFPVNLSRYIKDKNIFLIHFSTEAVFEDNLKELPNENYPPNPSTVYGNSKYLADKLLIKAKNCLVVRLPTLIGPTQNHQIVNKIIKKLFKGDLVHVSKDVYSTPINTIDFSNFLESEVISKKKFHKKKIIHVCSKKRLSTYQIIKLAVKEKKMRQNIIPVSESFFKSKFVKPKKLGLKSIYKECNRCFVYE